MELTLLQNELDKKTYGTQTMLIFKTGEIAYKYTPENGEVNS